MKKVIAASLIGCISTLASVNAQRLIVKEKLLEGIEVRAIHYSEAYGLIAGTGEGLVALDSSKASLDRASENPFPISALFEDSNANVWIGGLGFLRKVSDAESITYTIADDLKLAGRVIFSISEDLDRNIWVSAPGGAAVLVNDSWKAYATDTGLKHGVVHDVCHADNGAIWFATRKGGLNIFNESWNYDLENINTRKLLKGANGQIWVGTSAGLFTQEEDEWNAIETDRAVLPMFQDKQLNVWCIKGQTDVLIIEEDGKIQHLIKPAGDSVGEIYDMCLGDSDMIWLATDTGIYGCQLN